MAEDYPELKHVVYSEMTLGVFVQVLPDEIMTKALELERDPKSRKDPEIILNNIRTRLELDQDTAIVYAAHPHEVEENKKSFNIQVNSFKEGKEFSKPPPKKRFSPDHDCKTSKSCKKEWGGLGCSEVYKLHTVEERIQFLKERRLCFKCGEAFRFNRSPPRNWHVCRWSNNRYLTLEPVKCTKDACNIGAATCKDHQGGNATK